MSCNYPVTAWKSATVNPSGRRSLVFKKERSLLGSPEYKVPCQMCTGCRMERARQWAMRCMHEKRLHNASAFLTLTYRPENLPYLENGSATLVKRDLQLFLKRLRLERPSGLRFFACGEYGETTLRPHYHVLMLNTSFPDMKFHKQSDGGKNLYVSAELDGVWKLGNCLIGEVSFESCAYVAGYLLKNSKYQIAKTEAAKAAARLHYNGREKEFITMSLRPGLGQGYYLKYEDEVCAHDTVIVRGFECSVPKYYDVLRGRNDPKGLDAAKVLRRANARKRAIDNTNWRMHQKECFLIAKRRFWKRSSEV